MTQSTRTSTRAALFGVSLLVIAGCKTLEVGRDFSYGEFASRAKQGVTTKAQVQEYLGPPAGVGMVLESDGSKHDQWTYYFGSGTLPAGKDVNFKLLQIKFDTEGRLLSYTWSGETRQADKP
jgi:outer membrane protein assembly factor BamE (lipoprotein component of BamABCDE complex)